MSEVKWGQQATVLNVFVSSPDDVREERKIVNEAILEINRSLGRNLGITLQSRMWENFTPAAGDPMESIRKQLSDCDLFIMIFSRRFGCSVETADGEYKSGTEQEFNVARNLRAVQSGQKPQIHAYFKRVRDPETLRDPGPELQKVLEFKKRLRNTMFYKEYSALEAFRPLVKDNIIDWLCEVAAYIRTDVGKEKKSSILRRFFDLGGVRDGTRATKIVYPPISSKGASSEQDITHLLPYMVLEDFQAINKLTKNLALAGYDDVKAVTENLYRQQEHDHYANKIFLCLPRNDIAAEYLQRIRERRFDITKVKERVGDTRREVSRIEWKTKDGEAITVCSPQSQYLYLQRKDQGDAWHSHAGACLSVDFAVLAKFPDITDDLSMAQGLKAFFVFGIRGLGTWGATWYIDHQYEDLAKHFSSTACHQQLLRVEFRSSRIIGVEDVSDRPQGYFDQQNDKHHIARIISAESP